MDLFRDMKTLTSKEEVGNMGKEILDLLIDALAGDKKARAELIKRIYGLPMSAKTILFYDNFQRFLDGMSYDANELQEFQIFLKAEGKQVENSKRIVQIVDEMDSDFKVDTLIHLTQCAAKGFISKRKYFKLAKLLESMIVEDLEFLKYNICQEEVQEIELADEYVRNGLMYVTEAGGYAYSELAFDLDKYGLSYSSESRDTRYKYDGSSDFVPKRFPPKQGIITTIPVDEIARISGRITK